MSKTIPEVGYQGTIKEFEVEVNDLTIKVHDIYRKYIKNEEVWKKQQLERLITEITGHTKGRKDVYVTIMIAGNRETIGDPSSLNSISIVLKENSIDSTWTSRDTRQVMNDWLDALLKEIRKAISTVSADIIGLYKDGKLSGVAAPARQAIEDKASN